MRRAAAGKIQIAPDCVVGRDGDDLLLRNFEGGVYRYPDPGGNAGREQGALMRIGVAYDLRSDYHAMGLSEEETAEFDSEVSIDAICAALAGQGWDVDSHRQRQPADRIGWPGATAGMRCSISARG